MIFMHVNIIFWDTKLPCLKTMTAVSPISSTYTLSQYPASSAVGGVWKEREDVHISM